jgi:hypothetical protein
VDSGDGVEGIDGVRRRVRRLVADSADDGAAEDAARGLAADAVMLASFFQNVDLLYGHGFARADAVSGVIMRAVELLEGG